MRKLSYAAAINEALHQAMELSPDVMVLGQLVDYESGVFGTTTGLAERFGTDRVQDFPVAEGAMTTTAIGAALTGMRPVIVHPRNDFMLFSMDAVINWLSLWRFKTNGQSGLPVTIRAIVGRGWGQGPQHSKSLHAWFAHVPGLRVAVPATAHDAKGLLLESIFGNDPCVIIENRALFSMTDHVPEHPYRVRYGQAAIRRPGSTLTLVALGSLVPICLKVAQQLAAESIDVEVIDVRTVSPIDRQTLCESVRKTRRLAVADPGWEQAGMAAEIVSIVCQEVGRDMVANPVRICLPNSHTPMSAALEQKYYPDEASISATIRGLACE